MRAVPLFVAEASRRSGMWRLLALAVPLLAAATGSGTARDLPPISATGHHFLLPVGNGRLVYRFGNAAPEGVLEFWREHGRDWHVYWDSTLGTPRAVYPLTSLPIVAPELLEDTPAIVRAVESWIDRHKLFLGVDSSRLAEPYVFRIQKHFGLVFQQTTPSGIPVRGANLRVIVLDDGRLGAIKGFVARGIEDAEGALLNQEEVEDAARADGCTVHSARLEVAFLAEDLGSALPVWSLRVTEGTGAFSDFRSYPGSSSEHIVDARTGAVLARRVVLKNFGGEGDGEGTGGAQMIQGSARASSPDLNDIFASPFQGELRTEVALEGILIRSVERPPNRPEVFTEVATTDREGKFQFSRASPGPSVKLHAGLETGHIDPTAPAGSRLVPLVQVRPLGFDFELFPPLDGEGDANLDRVPDLTLAQDAGRDLDLHFNTGTLAESLDSRDRVHWIQAYEAGRKLTSFAEGELRTLFGLEPDTLRYEAYLPLSPLCILPVDRIPEALQGIRQLQCVQTYSPPAQECNLPKKNGPAELGAVVYTALFFDAQGSLDACATDAGQPEAMEAVVPTIIHHEVGHHVFFHLVQAQHETVDVAGLEDGVADALTAFANKNPRIGFKRDAGGNPVPTVRGFSLNDPGSGRFRHSVRKELAEGFWELRETLSQPQFGAQPSTAHQLLLGWLITHRGEWPDQHAFDWGQDIVDDLLWVDEFVLRTKDPKRDHNVANGTPNEGAIRTAFMNRRLFTDVPFVRGDANVDQRLDITDGIVILNVLFRGAGEMHDCQNAMDADDDGKVSVTDAIRVLYFLFLGADALPPPTGECGFDREMPGLAGNLGCREFHCPL